MAASASGPVAATGVGPAGAAFAGAAFVTTGAVLVAFAAGAAAFWHAASARAPATTIIDTVASLRGCRISSLPFRLLPGNKRSMGNITDWTGFPNRS